MKKSPLFLPAVTFIVGIVVGDHTGSTAVWWAMLSVSAVAVLATWREATLQSLAILLCMASLGGVRSSSVRQQHDRVTWPDGTVRFQAVVVSEPVEKPKTVAVDVVMVSNGRRVKCYVAKNDRSRRLQIGDRLQVSSHVERLQEWRRGSFDYRLYLEVHGFSGQTFVWADGWQLLSPSWEGISAWERLKLHFLCYRHQLLQRYRQSGIEDEEFAVVAAMTLGDKSAMTQELRDVYAVSGASHVLALSGLHLGIIYMLLSMLVMGRRFRFVAQALVVLGIWSFALLVGLPASVVRAAVMISVYALLSLLGRNRMSVNALALAAIFILLVSPDSLFDVGFQLSFAAMLAILTVQPLLERLVRREWLFDHPVVRWLWGLTTVSLAAQVGTAPLVAYYFGRFSTWFLLTNLIVIPATTAVLYVALASLLLPVLTVVLVRIVGWLDSALSYIAALPFASIEGLRPSALQVAMLYVIIVALFMIVMKYDEHI